MSAKDDNEDKSLTAEQSDGALYREKYFPHWLILTNVLIPFIWKYHVTITKEDLSFGYSCGMMKRKAPRSRVVAAEPFKIRALIDWGGWGIRLTDHIGYIARGGPGVKLILKNDQGNETGYVFSCKDPEKVCEILNNQTRKDKLERDENQ